MISWTCVQCATFIDRSDRMTILFFRSARNNQPGRGCLDLALCQVSLNSVRWLLRSENVSANQRPRRPSFFPIGPKTRTCERTLRSFFLSNFDEFCSAVSEEKSKMPQPIRGQGGHRLFRIEKHKLGRGRWDLASCQFSLNFVGWFQGRNRKCLNKSEARAAILFFGSARKYKLGRARLDLASYHVLLNSVQRRSRKCISQSEATAAILFFRSARKTQTW